MAFSNVYRLSTLLSLDWLIATTVFSVRTVFLSLYKIANLFKVGC